MDRVDAPASATHSGKSSLRPWWGAAAAALLAGLGVSISLLSGCEVVRSADETRVVPREGRGDAASDPSLIRLLAALAPGAVRPGTIDGSSDAGVAVVHEGSGSHGVADGRLCEFPLGPEESVLLRASFQASDGEVLAGRLLVRPVAVLASERVAHAESRAEEPRAVGWHRSHVHEAALEADGSTTKEIELFVPPVARRAGIALELVGGEGRVRVGEISIEPVPAWRRPLVALRSPDDRSSEPWRRMVTLDGERADALLLGAGGSSTWSVRVPERAPRLELLLASCGVEGGAPPRLAVTIDGASVADVPLDAPTGNAGRFRPAAVALDAFAGREVRLQLAVESDGDSVALLGAPLLRGAPAQERPNLVVISIDTLRADQLGCYGATPSVTPRLDRFATEGTRFAHVTAAAPWTLPSHATMFTGHPPSAHGATRPDRRLDAEQTPPLAPLLARHGYATAAFTGGGYVDPTFGFGAGFDHYSTRDPCRVAPEGVGATIERDAMSPAIDWLERHHDLPFFLFVHTYVVHDYAPNDEWLERTAPGSGLKARDSARLRVLFGTGDADSLPGLRSLYAAALAQADEELVGRLLDRLDSLGLTDRTVVALVSDHGDQWREHGGAFHNRTLWNEVTRVPWIVRGPGVPRGRVEAAVTGHCDVAPTLLARLGLAFDAPVHGRDRLQPAPDDVAVLSHAFTPEDGELDGLELGPWKLLRRRSDATRDEQLQLFRRDLDPAEREDLAAREPRIVAALLARLEQELAAAAALAQRPSSDERAILDSTVEQRLRELGYTTAR